MATTRIIPIHIQKGKTISKCLKARIDYAENPDKTEGGELISSYACAPETSDQEFNLARQAYLANTGRLRKGEVIAYQLRQSFKPGEITPEDANKIGYELAQRFLKGQHSFIVATHTDKAHIHNHIIFCATSIDCTRKFRNFWGSAKAVAHLSDILCMEHHLSVITDPKNKSVTHRQLQTPILPVSRRDQLRLAIDEALRKQPQGFNALMQLLEEAGWNIKRGKQYSFKAPDGGKFLRMDSLGEEYSEATLRAILSGQKLHKDLKQKTNNGKNRPSINLLIDIETLLQQNKGRGYQIWAERNNTTVMAKTMVYLKEHHFSNYDDLVTCIEKLQQKSDDNLPQIKAINEQMEMLISQRKTITDYRRTRDVYVQYKNSGWSSSFYGEHKEAIDTHMQAKKAYDAVHGQMPTLKEISEAFEKLKAEKQKLREEQHTSAAELKELLNVKSNIDSITQTCHEAHERDKETHSSRE